VTMSEHVSETDLLLAYDGELSPDRDEAVRHHRRVCGACEEKWVRLAGLSQEVAMLQCPQVAFRPEETAVAALLSRIDHVHREKGRLESRTSLASRWLVWGNTLAAVAVAITCIIWLPSLRVRDHAAAHLPAIYDFDQAVPAGYVSLPFADPALPLDDSTVLPVELTAEDLELMGIDAADYTNAAPRDGVHAEILLGMDGWPRAIRIVEQY
jgi:hypothetical protein